jgi:hypothetical protein
MHIELTTAKTWLPVSLDRCRLESGGRSRITHGCQVKDCIIILELYALSQSNNLSNRSYGQGNHNHGQSSNDSDPAVIIVGERKEWWLSLGHFCWSNKCCTWSLRMLVGPALRTCTVRSRSYKKLGADNMCFLGINLPISFAHQLEA